MIDNSVVEKLADEYAKEKAFCNECRDRNGCTPYLRCSHYNGLYHGYIDGFIAAKKFWHTKSDDLPPMINDERHLSDTVYISIKNFGTDFGYYDYNLNSWIVRCRTVESSFIMGWTDIPELIQ